MLELKNWTVAYKEKTVLHQINQSFQAGSIHGILGQNGAGKSTLFNSIYGMVKGTGECLYQGKELTHDQIAYLPTHNAFYPFMKGREYLELIAHKSSTFEAEHWNQLFQLPLHQLISQYSTGMKKKLAFLGIIAQDRPILILDEPFNGVDIESNDALRVIKSRDGADSFFYCDPPYFNSDMGHYKGYTEKDFTQLLETLSEVEGKFLLSSYPSDVLDGFTKKHKWHTITKQSGVAVTKQTNKIKIEVLTANYPMKSELNGANDQLQMKARCLKLNLNLVDV